MTKKIYSVKNMHCPSCALMIEGDLEDAGFKANCNYGKGVLEVELNEKIDEQKIYDIVKSSGYEIVAN